MTIDEAQLKIEGLMAEHGKHATHALLTNAGGIWFTTPKAPIFANELAAMLVDAHNGGREQAIRGAVIPAVRILNRYWKDEAITPGDRVAYGILVRETSDYIDRHELPKDAI